MKQNELCNRRVKKKHFVADSVHSWQFQRPSSEKVKLIARRTRNVCSHTSFVVGKWKPMKRG